MPYLDTIRSIWAQNRYVFVFLYYEKCLDITDEKGYHIYKQKQSILSRKGITMQINDRKTYIPTKKSVVALGNFDGIHLGHVALINKAVAFANESGLLSCVYTFSDHPSNFKNGINGIITDNSEKAQILSELRADLLCLDDFDMVKDLSCRQFCEEILVKGLGCEIAVCGDNYSFGAGRSGNADTLKRVMEDLGKKVVVLDCVSKCGDCINSTHVRELICEGKMEEASELLGRRYSFYSEVVHGKKLGRVLGSPTINQFFPEKKLRPKNGVYISLCSFDGKKYAGVTNVGVNPTVNDGVNAPVLCETHIIGFDGDLYGKEVRIEFCRHLRDEKKFPSLDELKKEILHNVSQAKEYFERETLL